MTAPQTTQDSPERARRDELDGLLRATCEADASDLHLTPGSPPSLRIHGRLTAIEDAEVLTPEQTRGLVDAVLGERDRARLEREGDLDGALSFSFTDPSGEVVQPRFRFNVFRVGGDYGIALRRLEERFRTLTELGLPESLHELGAAPDGLILVAGPTGSGKSTTLASLLHRINTERAAHIITIEDPVEVLHRPLQSVVNQREIGRDARTFAGALHAALRQDPDVILVGEIRERETIRTAITAAETGHLVFSTVHAGDVASAIERVVAAFPSGEQDGLRTQLSLVLRAVIAQQLLTADGPAASERARVLIAEVLRVTPAAANLIAGGKINQLASVLETGARDGMRTREASLAEHASAGRLSFQRALAAARRPEVLRRRLGREGAETAPRPDRKGGW